MADKSQFHTLCIFVFAFSRLLGVLIPLYKVVCTTPRSHRVFHFRTRTDHMAYSFYSFYNSRVGKEDTVHTCNILGHTIFESLLSLAILCHSIFQNGGMSYIHVEFVYLLSCQCICPSIEKLLAVRWLSGPLLPVVTVAPTCFLFLSFLVLSKMFLSFSGLTPDTQFCIK